MAITPHGMKSLILLRIFRRTELTLRTEVRQLFTLTLLLHHRQRLTLVKAKVTIRLVAILQMAVTVLSETLTELMVMRRTMKKKKVIDATIKTILRKVQWASAFCINLRQMWQVIARRTDFVVPDHPSSR
jgi:hypothetical protein